MYQTRSIKNRDEKQVLSNKFSRFVILLRSFASTKKGISIKSYFTKWIAKCYPAVTATKGNIIKCKCNKFLVYQRGRLAHANTASERKENLIFCSNELSSLLQQVLAQSEMPVWWWERFAPFAGRKMRSASWKSFSLKFLATIEMKNMFWLLNFISFSDLILSPVDWKSA